MYTTAKQYAEDARKLRVELVKSAPNNAEYRIDLYDVLNLIAELTLLERRGHPGDRQAVLDLLNEAVDTERKVTVEDNRSFRLREVLTDTYALRAEALADTDRAAALEDANRVLRFLDYAQKLYKSNLGYQFQRAAMLALVADLSGAPSADPRWADALAELKHALEGGYRDKHPDDIRERRYFAKLKGDSRFEELLAPRR